MKRIIYIAIAGLGMIAFQAGAVCQELPVKNVMSSGCLGQTRSDSQSASAEAGSDVSTKGIDDEVNLDEYGSVGISYSGNTLNMTLNAWEYNCGLSEFKPEAKIENGVITIAPGAVVDVPEWCLCHFNLSFDMDSVEEGKYLVRILPNESEEDIRLFEVDLRDGVSLNIPEEETLAANWYDGNTEWVYYNENANGDRNIFRLRFIPDEQTQNEGTVTMSIDGVDTAPQEIARLMLSGKGGTYIIPLTMNPPAILWRFASPSETVDLLEEGENLDVWLPIGADISQIAGEPKFFRDFQNHRMENLKLKDVEKVTYNLRNALKFIFDNGCEWIQGLGWLSPELPQSLIYPVFGGAFDPLTMTRLMYVREIDSNKIIYGSAAKDPSWKPSGVEATEIVPAIEIRKDGVTCRMNGRLAAVLYSSSGMKVVSRRGKDSVNLTFANLPKGTYVLECSNGDVTLTKKIIVD